jgi:Flp pilus assembly pilin Flp
MIGNEKGAATVEYVLIAVIVSVAAVFVLGPGSIFFQKVGLVFGVIANHVSIPGNWLVSSGF